MKARGIQLRQILILAGIGVLILLIMDFNNRMAELNRLSEQHEMVAAQATAQMQTRVHLETSIAEATSELAVEAWAREQGRLIQAGDHPIVPLSPAGGTAAPTPTSPVVVQPVNNLEVWLALFFESSQ